MNLGLILLANMFLIVGGNAITRKDMIAGGIAKWIRGCEEKEEWETMREYLCQPLFDCITCMASIWSFAGFFFCGLDWFMWPGYALILAGINATYGYIIFR